jgi:hypothetical protein
MDSGVMCHSRLGMLYGFYLSSKYFEVTATAQKERLDKKANRNTNMSKKDSDNGKIYRL